MRSEPWRRRSSRIRGPDHRIGHGTEDPSEQRVRHGDEVLELEGIDPEQFLFPDPVHTRYPPFTKPQSTDRGLGLSTYLLNWSVITEARGAE